MPPKKNISNKPSISDTSNISEQSTPNNATPSTVPSTATPTTTATRMMTPSSEQEDNNSIEKKYQPLVIELPESTNNIFDFDEKPNFSKNIDYPRFAYGFQHYIHANKNKMEILDQFKNKKKVYRVMNQFESHVDNYDESISEISKIYFDIKGDKPEILSRGFYKLWEMLFMFDLIDLNKENFVSAHLAEGPGSFIQATMFFRDKYSKLSKNDKYYAVTLHSEDTDGFVPDLEQKFVDFYEKEKPQRFMLHKTYPKQVAGKLGNKDNGDLTDPKTIKLFGGQMKEKADFVTADGGFNWENENTQEQEAFKLIFAQILAGVKIQKKGGSFVCKFFETYTKTSIKFISVLQQFYYKIYITKPLMSRPSNSEKYIVCIDFKYNDNDNEYKNMVKKLDKILELSHKNKELNLVDIFPNFEPNNELIGFITYLNIQIANNQFKGLNEIVEFVNSQNYYGDIYQMRRDLQIFANKYWISRFYPPLNQFNTNISQIRKNTFELIQRSDVLIREDIKKYD